MYSLTDLIDFLLNGESINNEIKIAYYLYIASEKEKLKSINQIADYALLQIANLSDNINDENTKKLFLDNSHEHQFFYRIKENIEENKETKKAYKFCPECGFKNEELFMFCPECGNSLKL